MLRNRVADFKGPESFLEAVETVTREPMVDVAVIRGVDDLIGLDTQIDRYKSKALGQFRNSFANIVPQATQMKDVLKPLWNDYRDLFDERIKPNYGLPLPLYIDYTSQRHIDAPGAGLVTISARIDEHHELKRTFYARKKVGKLGIDHHGMETAAGALSFSWLGHIGLSRVNQAPGDIVLFANFPLVTSHQVAMQTAPGIPYETPERKPAALVFSPRLYIPSMESMH